MLPSLKQNAPAMIHQIIREGETFRINSRNKSRETCRNVVATRDSEYGRRTDDGTWNTANGRGWIEYRQYVNDGEGSIKGCDSYAWVKMLENMTQVNGGGK